MVSIPMTVSGGLQSRKIFSGNDVVLCFNTDDGIWRATMPFRVLKATMPSRVSIPMTVSGGLQFRKRRLQDSRYGGFNTDDGIWRATILRASFEIAA